MRVPRLALRLAPGIAAIAAACGCFGSSNSGPRPDAGTGFDADVALDAGLDADSGTSGDSTTADSGPGAADGASDVTASDAGSHVDATAEASPGDAGESTQAVALGASTSGQVVGAASSDGSAMIVINTGANSTLWSHYEPSSGWSQAVAFPVLIPSPPQIGIDDAGNVFVAWSGSSVDGGHALTVARYDHAGQAWGPFTPIGTPYSFSGGTALAVNGPGVALALDTSADAMLGTHDVIAQRYSGGSWTPETIALEPSTYGVSLPILRLADTGVAVATFSVSTGSGGGYVVTTRSGTTWTPAAITPAPWSANRIDLAINGGGDVLVAFENSSIYPSVYRYDAASTTWTGPTVLSMITESAVYNCPIVAALTTSGDGLVMRCFDSTGARTLEYYPFTKSTAAWGAKTSLQSSGLPFFPAMAFDPAGDGVCTWVNGPNNLTPSAPAVMSLYEPATGWSAESTPLGGNVASYNTVFMSPNGRAWAAWTEGTVTNLRKVR